MDIEFFKRFVKTKDGVRELIKKMMQRGQQNVHTPYYLCKQMIGKLSESCDIKNSKIAVLFNVEFVETLITDFGVNPANIIMFADDKVEGVFCELQYKMKWGENLFLIDIAKTVEEKKLITDSGEMDMKFDVVVGNPPYQAPKTRVKEAVTGSCGSKLWPSFVRLSMDITKQNGFTCLIHPGAWRKPGSDLLELFMDRNLLRLEIHNIDDGMKTFGASTGYDWYILQNAKYSGKTIIIGSDKVEKTVDLSGSCFIANSEFDLLNNIIAKDGEEKCNVIYDRTAYGHDKKNVQNAKTEEFKYPVVYGLTQRNGLGLWWSNTKDKGHFGVKKVIIPMSKYTDIYIDEDGKYGLCEFAFGIEIKDQEEGENIKKAIMSDKFKKIWSSIEWIYNSKEWRVFKYFRKDFWKEFV